MICGVSSGYEFAKVVPDLEVLVDEWFDMNENERNAYVQEFNKMTIDEMKGKTIAASHAPTAQVSEFKEFTEYMRTILHSFKTRTDGQTRPPVALLLAVALASIPIASA